MSRALVVALCLALLAPIGVAADEAPADDAPPSDEAPDDADPVPPTTWPLDGRQACPSLRACCVPGEEVCTHPGLSRLLLGTFSGAGFASGAGMFLFVGDSLDSGDPQGALIGTSLIGIGGSILGLFADLLTPGNPGRVDDRPARPTVRLSLTPGGTATLDEAVPYGLGLRLDPTIRLGSVGSIQPHVGVSIPLGETAQVAPIGGNTALPDQEAGFPVVLRSWRMRVSVGAELAIKLPYPLAVKRPLYAGAIEVRWKPQLEVRRRVLHPGAANAQVIEHAALYPVNLGLRWHVAPRQRFTFYVGPRVDWLAFSDPGSTTMRRGGATLGAFYGEAWWQLDIPFSPLGRRKTAVNGRLNVGYIHSNLDGQRFDLGAIVGYFGPVELSFDLRIRKVGTPVAVQLTGGYRLTTGGGPFLEVGLVTPDIGKAGS